MDLGLTGKRALVLGSSKGLGHGIAEQLAAEGAHVTLVGRNEDRLRQAAEAITARGAGTARYVAVDMNGPEAVDRLMAGLADGPGAIDILVNNSGGPPPGNISAVTAEDWLKHFQAMVVTLIETTGRVLPACASRLGPHPRASSGVISRSPTSASPTRCARPWSTGARRCPGGCSRWRHGKHDPARPHPDGTAGAARCRRGPEVQQEPGGSGRHQQDADPVGRYGTVEEFASVATFLLSARASYVTGTVTLVDGGAVKSR